MFHIDKNSEIFFYGYSQFDFVKDKYSSMLSDGYKVIGYIDQRAQEIKKEVPCYTIQEFMDSNKSNENIVIIFLLQNGSQHENIAHKLMQEGYKKILFLPLNIDTLEKREMYEKYNLFLEEEYEGLNEIPEIDAVLNTSEKIRQNVRSGKKRDIYFVPTELLFSYNPNASYDNENIRFCVPYIELYDYLTGKGENCDHYLAFMRKENREEFLEDRKRMFLNYERERNFGMDYFVETAAYVKWNEKGYFNVIDGHHRAVYLAYKGYRQIPVRIEKSDFVKWENKKELVKLNNTWKFSCPVPVPQYLNEKEFFEPKWQRVVDFFYKELVSKGQTGLCFTEIDNNLGYYARYFERSGWFKCSVIIQNREDNFICSFLNNILYQNVQISAVCEKKVQAAYLDMDICEDVWMDKLLENKDFICLVFEVKDDNAKKVITKVESKMNSFVQLLCSYQDNKTRKIYGTIRRECIK